MAKPNPKSKSKPGAAAGKKPVKRAAKPVVFDEKAREEFITGFRKRKLEVQRSKKEKYEAYMKKEKAEKRREKRQKLKEVMDTMIETMEGEQRLMNPEPIEPETCQYNDEDNQRVTTVVTEALEL